MYQLQYLSLFSILFYVFRYWIFRKRQTRGRRGQTQRDVHSTIQFTRCSAEPGIVFAAATSNGHCLRGEREEKPSREGWFSPRRRLTTKNVLPSQLEAEPRGNEWVSKEELTAPLARDLSVHYCGMPRTEQRSSVETSWLHTQSNLRDVN